MNRRSVEDLIRLVEDSEINELTVEGFFTTVRIVKAPVRAAEREVVHAAPAPARAAAPVEEGREVVDDAETGQGLAPIVAPMVGTFYVSPSPEAPAYVRQGDRVNKGQVVCIVEAMKLMNEIESDVSGTITKVAVANGQPVEYGQTLFLVQPD
jgi:acetyl-CoA carboxylase biotin carboxyl carrier protein